MKWIDTKTRLPPQDVYVLVSKRRENKGVGHSYFTQIACRMGHQWFDDHDGEEIKPKEGVVTHWMPLPDDPDAVVAESAK